MTMHYTSLDHIIANTWRKAKNLVFEAVELLYVKPMVRILEKMNYRKGIPIKDCSVTHGFILGQK